MSEELYYRGRNIISLTLFLIGIILCVISLAAEIFGLDITPGFGVVQMVELLLGLTMLTGASFFHMQGMRKDKARSLQADIGLRLAATGLIFAYVSGLSDVIGIGTHVPANEFERPFVGGLQLGGLVIGIITITIGMLLYYATLSSQDNSLIKFASRSAK